MGLALQIHRHSSPWVQHKSMQLIGCPTPVRYCGNDVPQVYLHRQFYLLGHDRLLYDECLYSGMIPVSIIIKHLVAQV